jgi:hypothetical protein
MLARAWLRSCRTTTTTRQKHICSRRFPIAIQKIPVESTRSAPFGIERTPQAAEHVIIPSTGYLRDELTVAL